jgi:hypothetical protein
MHFAGKDTHGLKIKGQKMIHQASWKEIGIAILISDYINFERELVRRGKEYH